MASWLCIVKPHNWRVMKKHRLFGVSARALNILQRAKPGDLLVVYATRPISGVVAVCRIKSPIARQINWIWGQGKYPFRVQLELLPEFSRLEREPVNLNSIYGDKRGVTVTPWFLGRSMIPLAEEDFKRFLNALRQTTAYPRNSVPAHQPNRAS